MKRGIQFHIPNAYGSFLGEILKPIGISNYDWFVGGGESYVVVDDTLGESLFPNHAPCMTGEELQRIVEDQKYYLIFADLKAFPRGDAVPDVQTYKDYAESDCQIALLVIDSCYTAVYMKDAEKREELYNHVKRLGCERLDYITDENDSRTRISVW